MCDELHDVTIECVKDHLFEDLPKLANNGQLMITTDIQRLACATEKMGCVMGQLDDLCCDDTQGNKESEK
ncbi:hypothetical protein LCGC14_0941590 [marine sediment metagenome]|uniref:Uncharacterized protein n=1 Tax=marine sediment metagenome TaxID=412755 RepID=A0A0F9RR84_9ZZZZ